MEQLGEEKDKEDKSKVRVVSISNKYTDIYLILLLVDIGNDMQLCSNSQIRAQSGE